MRLCASEVREEIWKSQCSVVKDATKIYWWLKGNFCQAAEPNTGCQGCDIKQEAQISHGQVLMVSVWQFSQGTPYTRPSLPNSHRSPLDNMVFPNLPSFKPPWEKPQVEYTIYSVPCLVTKTHILRKPGSEMSPGQQAGTHVTPHGCFPGRPRLHSAVMSVEYHQWLLPPLTPQWYCHWLLSILEIWSVVLPDFINSDMSWQVFFQHFSSLGVILGVPMGEGSGLIFCQPLADTEKTSETSICQS